MIGTRLVEELVQSVALSHRVGGYSRVSLLMLADPESGKTTIAAAADAKHVARIVMISGRSVIKEINKHKATEFFLFNDLTTMRALSPSASAFLISVMNQVTQGEKGKIALAGKTEEYVSRDIGFIGCMPFKTFVDHRAKWQELGFISRAIPFAYKYPKELIVAIKDLIDDTVHLPAKKPVNLMPKAPRKPVPVRCDPKLTRTIRHLADLRSEHLGQIGLRLLQNYHCLIRARALLKGRTHVTDDDIGFLREVDSYVSITACQSLNGRVSTWQDVETQHPRTHRPRRHRPDNGNATKR